MPEITRNKSMLLFSLLQAIVWDEYLTGPFGLIAQYSLLKVHELFGFYSGINDSAL